MNGNKVVWIVLALVLLALLLFLLLGRNPAEEAANNIYQAATTTEQVALRAAVRTEAAAELAALQARQQAGESYETLRTAFADVRVRLAAAYENAEDEAQQEWEEIKVDFDAFEAGARAGTSNSLNALNRLIARLSADVRTETSSE